MKATDLHLLSLALNWPSTEILTLATRTSYFSATNRPRTTDYRSLQHLSEHCLTDIWVSHVQKDMAASADRSYSPEYLERLSSPDYLAGDESSSDPQSVVEPNRLPDATALLSADEDRMDSGSSVPSQERSPVGSDSNEENPPLKRFKEGPGSYYESSDNYIPPNRLPTSLIDSDGNEEPTSSKQSKKGQTNYYESSDNHIPPNRPLANSTTNPPPKKPTQNKKPSKLAAPSKPPKKNDPTAKAPLIHQIQHHWGPNFTKSFVPKCHRPLVKSSTCPTKRKRQRPLLRKHESNPHNWNPSSLTSILRIAKLTSDKEWLHKAMRDVVRYRIRHTGNRKPQLGRADFDVIEDMLGKGWGVEYAFGVRYKHLAKEEEREGEEEEEDVEYLFDVGPESGSDEEAESDETELRRRSKEVRRKRRGDTGSSGKGKKRQSERGDEVCASSSSSSSPEETVNPYQHAWCKSRYGMFPPLPHASSSSAHSTLRAKKPEPQGTRKRTQQSTQRGKDVRHSPEDSLFVPEGMERDEHGEFEEEEEEEEEERDYEAEIAAAEAELKLARLRVAAAKAKKLKRKK